MSREIKTSSRKRKLAYIREKNHYRLGGEGGSFFKISNELIKDTDFVANEVRHQSTNRISFLQKKFKMAFGIVGVEQGLDSNDFIMNLTTIKITYNKTSK